MFANDRLITLQSALKDSGVTDVKFCFSLALAQIPSSEVITNVADSLQAFLDGKLLQFTDFGDPA